MQKQFRSDIEGLRAVAVLSVVIFHFGVEALAAQPMRSVALGVTLTVVGGAIASSVSQAARDFSSRPLQAELTRAIEQEPTASGSHRNCLIGFRDATPVKCVFGASNAERTVVLFGALALARIARRELQHPAAARTRLKALAFGK